jgi:hypothetical protein
VADISRREIGMIKVVVAVLAATALVVAAALTAVTAPGGAGAADHLDAPGLTPPGGDPRTDITDIYAFRAGSDTVLVLNVNGLMQPGVQAPFAAKAPSVAGTQRVTYNLRVDNDGDAAEDVVLSVGFGRPNSKGVQRMVVRRDGTVLARGRTSAFGDVRVARGHGIEAYAGMRDDPFFFDLGGFLNILSSEPGKSFIGCTAPRQDSFAGTNVSSIVLQVPSRLLTRSGSTQIGVWATTDRGGVQIDRMGRPAIATVFIPNNPFEPAGSEPSQKNAYNAAHPRGDQASFRGEVVDTLATLYSLNDGAGDDPSDDAAKIAGLADVLLPDILTFDTSSSAGFLNGRRLADDVIDAELGLVTEGAVTTDCVGANDRAFSSAFPYLAGPHA